jgi:DNA primase catalytic core
MTESEPEPSGKRAADDGAQDEALFHAGRRRECSPAPDLDELDTERALVEANRWDKAPVQRARLLELNELAAGFFTAGYANSWGPQYVNSRLGTDLADHGGFRPGYAPAGWTTLTEHLRHLGAGDQEILAAGLGRVASTGAIIDLFRERLVLPIRNGREIHGFIGRRQPAPADRGKAGPKYLNTPATDLFDKSAQLFGLSEGRAALDAGATPVLVEGFFDAIAVTLAAGGRQVGLAPLGTSLTASQANQLRPYVGARRPEVTVATDADLAGEIAAQRAFWMLAARGHAPRHVLLPHGQDPAEVLARGGPMALRACLQDAHPLARHLLDERRNHLGEGPQLLAECAAIIAAAPPYTWVEQIDYAGAGTNFGPGALRAAVAGAARRWTLDPLGSAQAQIGDLRLVRTRLQRAGEIPLPADGPSEPVWGADLAAKPLLHRTQSGQPDLDGATASVDSATQEPSPLESSPLESWRELAHSIDPRLTTGQDWPTLSRAIQEADAAGFDVAHELGVLAAGGTVTTRHAATELAYLLRDATQTTSDTTPTLGSDPKQPAASSPARSLAQARPSRRHTAGPMR